MHTLAKIFIFSLIQYIFSMRLLASQVQQEKMSALMTVTQGIVMGAIGDRPGSMQTSSRLV